MVCSSSSSQHSSVSGAAVEQLRRKFGEIACGGGTVEAIVLNCTACLHVYCIDPKMMFLMKFPRQTRASGTELIAC